MGFAVKRGCIIVGLVVTFTAAALGTDYYARREVPLDMEPLKVDSDVQNLVIIVHGRGDSADDWPRDLKQRLTSLVKDTHNWQIIAYDWYPHALSSLRSAANGTVIGRQLGKKLASLDHLTQIHLIGHSVGSFLIDELCRSYKAHASNPAHVHMTFLDPFCMQGTIHWKYGMVHFGEKGDFTEAFINTDDPVPTTNAPLHHAYNYDVTQTAGRESFEGELHWWPVEYYIGHLDSDHLIGNGLTHAKLPRGEVTSVP